MVLVLWFFLSLVFDALMLSVLQLLVDFKVLWLRWLVATNRIVVSGIGMVTLNGGCRFLVSSCRSLLMLTFALLFLVSGT
ncbi:hypothetical protein C2G38_1240013 [Gigaspora rosea]|uniref:Uncharacterized protein n=1 Tax=Gigaspora rosea TaxID=44941 RepID=A0A397VDB6_9GLOM|nr:hypothetical protein C2G38_1240013 [Gigaspora rosea]